MSVENSSTLFSASADRVKLVSYASLNLFRVRVLQTLTSSLPSSLLLTHIGENSEDRSFSFNPPQHLNGIVNIFQGFVLPSKAEKMNSKNDQFDLYLSKREILLFFMLIKRTFALFAIFKDITMWRLKGASILIFVILNYIGFSNRMNLFLPFLLGIILVYMYYMYFRVRDDSDAIETCIRTG